MKKVLFANTSFLPAIGGVENSIRSLIKVFSEAGWECHLTTKELDSKYTKSNVKISYYNNNNVISNKGVFRVLLRIFDLYKFDVVIVRHHLLAFLIAFLYKDYIYVIPGIYEFQNIQENKGIISRLKFWIHVWIQRHVIKNCKNNVVFSSEMHDQVRSFNKICPLLKFKPGADEQRFYRLADTKRQMIRQECGYNDSDIVIFGIGRLVDVKNFKLVIESLVHLPNHFKLLLAGEGPDKVLLEAHASALGLSERINFYGKANQPEQLYGSVNIFCLPSTYEPFGQVLLEAAFSSLPIIAIDSDLSGINTATKEVFSGYNDLVFFADNDPCSYALQIIEASKKLPDADIVDKFKSDYSWSTLRDNLILLGNK
ncbi:glycosyltransferase family 4 protein [Shewanella sp. NKUCC05_KAH]|uniref:glycosyltransferase family 4 protein n=1 Tax=Shewanella sp. NKUCC05_KAH TaxID=2842126 RepID=UPI001C5B8ED1|nr:glycosyltransferase family 4 protein [Shewanella sp. NKUCC05_KAH]MBW3526224.1 glycosyltransferase family 4 protein [Shewanella sp. NKUCC05_KAH]